MIFNTLQLGLVDGRIISQQTKVWFSFNPLRDLYSLSLHLSTKVIQMTTRKCQQQNTNSNTVLTQSPHTVHHIKQNHKTWYNWNWLTERKSSNRPGFGVPSTQLLFIFFLLSHFSNKSIFLMNGTELRSFSHFQILT